MSSPSANSNATIVPIPTTIEDELKTIQKNLDKEIGFYYWKKYIASAFWSNISTPINLAITLLTAITTGQATTEHLIPQNIYVNLSIATLIISTLNTFFRPHTQMNENITEMKKWNEFGSKYSNIRNNLEENEEDTPDQKNKAKLLAYRRLQRDIHDYLTNQASVNQNFLTDLIHIFSRQTCLKGRENWNYLFDKAQENNTEKKSCFSCC